MTDTESRTRNTDVQGTSENSQPEEQPKNSVQKMGRPAWRDWKWWLPYLSGLVGSIVLGGTVVTFTVSFSRDAYRWLTSKDKVEVINLSTPGPQAFLNSGDGQLFLSHVDVKGPDFATVIFVNKVINPREFLTIPVSEESRKEHGGKSIVATDSDAEWQEILTKVKGAADPAYVQFIFATKSPELKMYKERLGKRLRTFPFRER